MGPRVLSQWFVALLLEFYKCRTVFWHTDDGEFADAVDKLDLPGVVKLNGRTWIPMEAVLYQNRLQYYQAIKDARHANDSSVFIEFTLSALYDIIAAQEKYQVKHEDKHQVGGITGVMLYSPSSSAATGVLSLTVDDWQYPRWRRDWMTNTVSCVDSAYTAPRRLIKPLTRSQVVRFASHPVRFYRNLMLYRP